MYVCVCVCIHIYIYIYIYIIPYILSRTPGGYIHGTLWLTMINICVITVDQLNATQDDFNVVSNLEIQLEVALEIAICYNGGLTSQFLFHLIRSPFSMHFHSFTSIRTNKKLEETLFL